MCRATINDVAGHANVARETVSRAFGTVPAVRPAARAGVAAQAHARPAAHLDNGRETV